MTPVHDCTLVKMVAHTFLPSFDNANDRLCHEQLLRSKNFASMVTRPHTSILHSVNQAQSSVQFALRK